MRVSVEQVTSRVVPRDAYVMIETNRYPVPYTWVGQTVEVRITSGEIAFISSGHEPVRHVRVSGKYKHALWSGPRRELPHASVPAGDAPPISLVCNASLLAIVMCCQFRRLGGSSGPG